MAIETFSNIHVDRSRIEQRLPMQRLGQATEIAAAVSFLVSKDAFYNTGVTSPVDGG